MQPILVTTSCGTKTEAKEIGRKVLEKRLGACIQIRGPVSSSYWWKNEIETSEEYLVDIKSEKTRFASLAELIRTVHSYEVPEIIAVEITDVDAPYLAWLTLELADGAK